MEIFHIFDTETTGIPLNGVDIEDPRQPHIVQLASALCSEDGEIIDKLNCIIKPEGFDSIAEGAFRAHGISIERCHEEGRPMKEVLEQFNVMKEKATARVAYNISFDKRMLLREAKKQKMEHDSTKFENSSYCVMRMATPICNLPPTGKMIKAGFDYKPKPPKLIEAYRHFFGNDFERAHDAMNDVMATKEIFFYIKDNHPDNFKPEPVKVPYVQELSLKPAPNGQGEDAALVGTLAKVAGEAF